MPSAPQTNNSSTNKTAIDFKANTSKQRTAEDSKEQLKRAEMFLPP